MSSKLINIVIPNDAIIPEIINSFSPDENYMMLKIGSNCLLEGRNYAVSLSQDEIYKKIKEESKLELNKLELDLLVERETAKLMEEKIKNIYENMYEIETKQMKKQMEGLESVIAGLREQIKSYESGNKDLINYEVDKVREKYDLLLKEKEIQNKLNWDLIDNLKESVIKLSNKSASHKGSAGEQLFKEYADVFMDYKGFQILDKHSEKGKGDFHLCFDEFNILVDAKNYTRNVPVEQREKIKRDLLKNEHINFGWLVSLNTSIDKWDKCPVMHEWINTHQCLIYINNLSSFEDPKKILRMVWNICKELYKFIDNEEVDMSELNNLRERQFKINDKIKNLRKNIRELNTNINLSKNIVQNMDDELREILEYETINIINSNFSIINDWWDKNIELNNDSTVLSTDLWMIFKQEKKHLIKEMDIKVENFKQFIKTKVPSSCLNVKSKNVNSAFEINGVKLKQVEVNTEEGVELELVESGENINVKNKKSNKKVSYYFNEEMDKLIIKDYEDINKDIIMISDIRNIKIWQVVSVLMKHNIISKRNESRGYDKYKETEEYKSKIKE
jgi:hypothetical protein